MSSSGSLAMYTLVMYAQLAFHLLLALAFGIVCAVRARKVGVAGSWMFAGVAAIDVLSLVMYQLATLSMRGGNMSMSNIEGVYAVLGLFNVVLDLVSIGLVGGAYFLLRKAPA